MKYSLVITTFNRPEALRLVLKSIEVQSVLPDEVIIADDGSNRETQKLINDFLKKSNLNIIHSWQSDKGFRAAKSRNKAIAKSKGDYIILIDGDMILHDKFIQDHIQNAERGFFVQGSRVLLTKDKTIKVIQQQQVIINFLSTGLINRKNAIYSKILSNFFHKKKNYLSGIKSCNLAFFKQDCIDVNGFNNLFEGWGREDSEFVIRLMNNNIQRKTIHFNSIQFHLWHDENPRISLEQNDALLKHAIINNSKWCNDGINKFFR
jgi:glycosyltransferase involved in cell wall biosynthesis